MITTGKKRECNCNRGNNVGTLVYVLLLLGTIIIYVITINFSTVICFTVVGIVIAVIIIVGVTIVNCQEYLGMTP